MKIVRTYSIKICHYNRIFMQTVALYRKAVDFFISVCMEEWDCLSILKGKERNNAVEALTVRTKKRPAVRYDFSMDFYKFPSYLRRSAISEALGKTQAYMSLLSIWKKDRKGRMPGYPNAGRSFPVLYRGNSFVRVDDMTAGIKVFIRNTWDWITVRLRKTDMDYILRHMTEWKECSPALQKRGKEWFLDFPYEKSVKPGKKDIRNQKIIAVDLGINSACVCTAMLPDGTVAGRRFLHLPAEEDRLKTAVNRIKKAQKKGARRTPRLWAVAKGLNDDIAVKTAAFIISAAEDYKADVIVFEHLDVRGRKRGSKKLRLHLWKADYVQKIVADRAHVRGMRISRICAWGTSSLAYDGSGRCERGIGGNYSICRFKNGKIYNCDLNASYNIGARYYIREIEKTLPETERLDIRAKVPECARRSTCTLSTLINLKAALSA